MNFKLICCTICAAFVFSGACYAQSNPVSVNLSTGAANVNIPLFNITHGAVAVPVSISYNGNGIKPKDVEGKAGMGWQLNAGGAVTRQVRGLPDDATQDGGNNAISGWMHNSNQSLISSFSIANNGSNCTNSTADLNYISSHFSYTSDTEPDLFTVSAPGLTCQLVYDQSISNFRTIPYQDLKITYTTNSAGNITSFTIVNDKGITYVFGKAETAYQITANPASSLNYFYTTYYQYRDGMLFSDAWFLTSITDANSQGVEFNYTTASSRGGSNPVRLYLAGSTTATTEYSLAYNVAPVTLSNMSTFDGDVFTTALTFTWANAAATGGSGASNNTGQTELQNIAGRGRSVGFGYTLVQYTADGSNYTRCFLTGVGDAGCESPISYGFNYLGVTAGSPYYTTSLTDSTSKKFDYWGYNNSSAYTIPLVLTDPTNSSLPPYTIGVLGGEGSAYTYSSGTTNMYADTVNETAGSLSTITNVTGGTTTISYQSNDYVDQASGNVVKGGGLRVKQITDYDDINVANNIVRTYSYIDTTTHVSSGKPISLPQFAFTIPTGTGSGSGLWTSSTAISDADLSPEDHTIIYGTVRETRAGAGSTLYQYYTPATTWDSYATADCNGCTTPEWYPTYNYVAPESCTGSYGLAKNNYTSYPFVPNENYDFERYLPKQVTTYNNAGKKVSETDYSYQRSNSPVKIPALEYTYNGGSGEMMAYSTYNIFTTASELTSQVTNKVFDSNTLGQSQQTSVSYTYGSANHKLPTIETTTNSDGTLLSTHLNYTKDYSVSGSTGNANVTALYNLQQLNVNVPVETWQQVGSVYTGATLTLFNAFGGYNGTHYLPSNIYKLFSADGQSTFSPMTISGSTITKDPNYLSTPSADYTYDADGAPMTVDDGHQHEQAMVTNHANERVVLIANNCAAGEIAYQDFDSYDIPSYNNITISGSYTSTSPAHAGNGAAITTSNVITSPTITKNVNAKNYILSMWINSGTATGSPGMSITVTPNTGSPATYNKTFTATASAWQYFEWKVPVGSSVSSFTLTATPGVSISVDDIILYPDNAEVTTHSFDPTTFVPTSATNTNGVSTYYKYDQWGRMLYTFDRYMNILTKNTYATQTDVSAFKGIYLAVGPASTIYTNTSVTLSTSLSSCLTNLNYLWNFGDGYTVNTSTPSSPPHTYATATTYTASVTISSPSLGNATASQSIPVQTPPPTNAYIHFSNTTGRTQTDLSTVAFYQGSTLIASYGYAQIPAPGTNTISIPSGSYTVKVTMNSHATGYGNIEILNSGASSPYCQPYAAAGVYTYSFSVTIPSGTSSINISENLGSCPGGGE